MASCGKIERLTLAYLDNELSAAERVVFEQHLSECAACTQQLSSYKAMAAGLFETFSESGLRSSLRAAVMAHLPEMEHTGEHHPSWQPQYKPVRFQWLRTLAPALAPVLVLLLGITLIYAWPQSESLDSEAVGMILHKSGDVTKHNARDTERRRAVLSGQVYAGERYETGAGASLMVALAGPTLLKADENTRFRIDDDRKIRLESGRIWFNVAKDPRTFLVDTQPGQVTVFGTTFDVAIEDAESVPEPKMTVTVAAGEVQVDSGTGFRKLHPGQRLAVVRGQRTLLALAVDLSQAMAWASAIQPDVNVAPRFIRKEGLRSIPADDTWDEMTFHFDSDDLKGRNIGFLLLTWLPDAYSTGHSGYNVYFLDGREPVFMEYIPGRVFDGGSGNSYKMAMPPNQALGKAVDLRIRLVPDRSGLHATTFKELSVSN